MLEVSLDERRSRHHRPGMGQGPCIQVHAGDGPGTQEMGAQAEDARTAAQIQYVPALDLTVPEGEPEQVCGDGGRGPVLFPRRVRLIEVGHSLQGALQGPLLHGPARTVDFIIVDDPFCSWMGNLYVVRHGQTDCNAQGVLQGPRIDALLSDIGHQQAAALGRAFLETPLDGVYTSPLRRARQTAQGILEAHTGAVPGTVVPELYEMDYGDYCGRPLHQVETDIEQLFDAWSMGFIDQAFPGGESPLLAQHRIRAFALRLLEQASTRDMAVVAHGRINRVLLATLTQGRLDDLERWPQANANITHLEAEDGELVVRRMNDTSHLDDVDDSFS